MRPPGPVPAVQDVPSAGGPFRALQVGTPALPDNTDDLQFAFRPPTASTRREKGPPISVRSATPLAIGPMTRPSSQALPELLQDRHRPASDAPGKPGYPDTRDKVIRRS